MSGLLALEADGAKRAKYLKFIDIYAELTDNDLDRYRRQYPEEDRIVTGYFQRAREAAEKQGIEQGIEQGRAQGERAVLERLLRRRFGALPPDAAERLRQATRPFLATWADNLLDARTLDEVFLSTPEGTARVESP